MHEHKTDIPPSCRQPLLKFSREKDKEKKAKVNSQRDREREREEEMSVQRLCCWSWC